MRTYLIIKFTKGVESVGRLSDGPWCVRVYYIEIDSNGIYSLQ